MLVIGPVARRQMRKLLFEKREKHALRAGFQNRTWAEKLTAPAAAAAFATASRLSSLSVISGKTGLAITPTRNPASAKSAYRRQPRSGRGAYGSSSLAIT